MLKKSISFQHIKHENFMNKSIDSDHVGDSEELMKLDHFSDNEIEKYLLAGKFQKPINHSDVQSRFSVSDITYTMHEPNRIRSFPN